ncbi:hypothetical protein G7054_g6456 [Neopestalotiopsis clavispora]|nr:hypothetical protein G7054_g6456 [Neopestalotiopsis clavispora]
MDSINHSVISPAILYWGTPVVLITSQNEDGTSNIAPMSSAFWLGHSCVLGLDATSKTTENLLRTKECVLNLPSDSMVAAVNELADTTGSNPVSASKASRNYKFVKDKWSKSGLSPQPSDFVQPCRIAECPVQMECQFLQVTNLRPDLPDRCGLVLAIEVRVLRIHIDDELRMEGYANRVDPDKWKPLIMNFQEFYGLKSGKIGPSVLGRISEEKYRGLTKSDVAKLPGDDDALAN